MRFITDKINETTYKSHFQDSMENLKNQQENIPGQLIKTKEISIYKELGEPFIEEFSESFLRIRRNLLLYSTVINITIFYDIIKTKEVKTNFLFADIVVEKEYLYKIIIFILIYNLFYFILEVVKNFNYNKIRLTGIHKINPSIIEHIHQKNISEYNYKNYTIINLINSLSNELKDFSSCWKNNYEKIFKEMIESVKESEGRYPVIFAHSTELLEEKAKLINENLPFFVYSLKKFIKSYSCYSIAARLKYFSDIFLPALWAIIAIISYFSLDFTSNRTNLPLGKRATADYFLTPVSISHNFHNPLIVKES